ncbi:tetratricopeptide repeat protein [Campylobacter sp. CX2-8023-23]|uniref:beta-lactamase n=1 Tax=Campylobacter porcelli TaxID=1660073 RepID=A0ABU7M6B6_9BACT|nr:tetratricopeptide repeat protein [Campylobacter sp. CX2-8023-23]MEE3745254.1 tetratricopeptide repeat protein [Campylobacter sp. CX2-4855-23]MEE3777437.1 tetratricopeptide repeat protein [Campylobacter sp. CX2-4080-23]
MCCSWTLIYIFGNGVRQNHQKAAELIKKACDNNDTLSCIALGILYENGKGLRQDYTMAKEYYDKACKLGDQKGCDRYKRLSSR